MTTTQTAFKVVRRSKYADFDQEYVRVPVQYGHLSRRERRCYYLGRIGSMPEQGEVYRYYRICEGERGARRFFVIHRVAWKEKNWDFSYYLRYEELPQKIRDAIEGEGRTVWEKLGADEIWADAHRARATGDDSFFAMPAEQLVDYLNAYERNEPRAEKRCEGNILDDVIYVWPWECVDEQATMDRNKDLKNPHDAVVVLKSGATIRWDGARWTIS